MRRLVLAAIAIIGAAFAVPAFAAPVNVTAPLSNAGAISTEERLPDRDYVLIQPRVFQTRFVYGADGASNGWGGSGRAVTIDSSTAIPTKGYKQLALMFQFVVDDSVQAALFALQTRGHMTAGIDTLSTYAWANITPGTRVDTIGSIYERDAARLTQWGAGGADTALTVSGERPMYVVWSQGMVGQNIVVLINGKDGTPFTAPYTSWRLRIMNTFDANGAAYGQGTASAYGAANLSVFSGICEKCGGHPARNAYGRSVTVTADLVGWR